MAVLRSPAGRGRLPLAREDAGLLRCGGPCCRRGRLSGEPSQARTAASSVAGAGLERDAPQEGWGIEMRVVRLSVVAAMLVVFASATVVLANGRVALVVGNSTYAHIGRLPNPENDAVDMTARGGVEEAGRGSRFPELESALAFDARLAARPRPPSRAAEAECGRVQELFDRRDRNDASLAAAPHRCLGPQYRGVEPAGKRRLDGVGRRADAGGGRLTSSANAGGDRSAGDSPSGWRAKGRGAPAVGAHQAGPFPPDAQPSRGEAWGARWSG